MSRSARAAPVPAATEPDRSPSPTAEITVQRRVAAAGIPAPGSLRRFALAAGAAGSLCLRLVDAAESCALNRQWRGRDRPTNVLSFAAGDSAALQLAGETAAMGDIVLCAPVIAAEAVAQGKPARAHWAHMVVHGVLHLRGFDHVAESDAERMEAEERRILATLGVDDPYSLPGERPGTAFASDDRR